MTDEIVLEGSISVIAAIEARNRIIHHVYVQKNKLSDSILRLNKKVQSIDLEIEQVDQEFVDNLAQGKSHGGIIALAGPRKFLTLDELIPKHNAPFIVMLDGIEDPYNFGTAVRSMYAAGVDGLVLRPRNWMSAAGIVAKSSAGASELIPTAIAETVLDAATFFKQRKLTVAAADSRKGSVSVYASNLSIPLFLLIGGEKRGITRSFIDRADIMLHIPYDRVNAQDLGTAAATAIICFEVMRQKNYSDPK